MAWAHDARDAWLARGSPEVTVGETEDGMEEGMGVEDLPNSWLKAWGLEGAGRHRRWGEYGGINDVVVTGLLGCMKCSLKWRGRCAGGGRVMCSTPRGFEAWQDLFKPESVTLFEEEEDSCKRLIVVGDFREVFEVLVSIEDVDLVTSDDRAVSCVKEGVDCCFCFSNSKLSTEKDETRVLLFSSLTALDVP